MQLGAVLNGALVSETQAAPAYDVISGGNDKQNEAWKSEYWHHIQFKKI